jgi:lactobin A/cerein 7B family class IIb bacteriocin
MRQISQQYLAHITEVVMTTMVLDVRELTFEEIEEVTGSMGPVGAAVGAVIGGMASAGHAMASVSSPGTIIAAGLAGAAVGGVTGFFVPGGSAGLA